MYAFAGYVGTNKTITIPSTVTTIDNYAFNALDSTATIVVNKPNLDGIELGTNWNGNATVKCKSNNQIIDCP